MRWLLICLVVVCLPAITLGINENVNKNQNHLGPLDLKAPPHPHIVFMAIDDLGYTDVSYSGAEYKTPNIDALAASSYKLNQYYTDPTCTPSRSSFMTGRYSFRTGLQSIFTNQPATYQHIPDNVPVIAELLKEANYTTHMLGKWHLGYSSWNQTPTGRGFDHHFGYLQGAQYYYNHTMAANLSPNAVLGYDFWRDREVLNITGNYSTDVYTDETLSIIENHDPSVPLFLYLSFQTIHAPIQSPPFNKDDNDTCYHITSDVRRSYCLKMLALDRSIGVIVDALKTRGIWDNMFGIFSTDNGGMVSVGGGGYFQNDFLKSESSNYPLRAGKITCFEGGVKGLAFLFGGDHVFPSSLRGTSGRQLFHAVDLPATFLSVAGLPIPSNYDGISILDVVNNRTTAREVLPIHIEQFGTNFTTIRWNQWKLIVGTPFYDGYFIPGQEVIPPSSPCNHFCLFDIDNDPNETTDLASSHKEIAVQMFAKIESFVTSGDYMKEQSSKQYPEGMPDQNGGVWRPWVN